MTNELKEQLEEIAKQLGGVVEYKTYCDLKTTHEKVVKKSFAYLFQQLMELNALKLNLK